MDASDIIQIIRRRRTRFQSPPGPGSQETTEEAARVIAEEYDSLLAEIEAVRKSAEAKVTDKRPEAESANQAAEAEILGDQGQSGG